MTRKSYTTDFKREAASLVLDQGYSVRTACEAMDVGHTAMRRWVNQLRQEREGITPEKSKALPPEQQRIQELEARLRKVEREKEILKKAAPRRFEWNSPGNLCQITRKIRNEEPEWTATRYCFLGWV